MSTKRDDVAYAVRFPDGTWSGSRVGVHYAEWRHRALFDDRGHIRSDHRATKVTRRKVVKLSKEAKRRISVELRGIEFAIRDMAADVGPGTDDDECIAWLEEMRRRLSE